MKNISDALARPFSSLVEQRSESKLLEDQKRDRLTSGKSIIDLSMINPDIAPPRVLQDRLVEATLNPANNRYAVSRGIRKLRDGFCFKYQNKWGVSLSPESDVCVTMGSKDATLQTLKLLSMANKRKILLPSPCYPVHRIAAELVGMEISYFSVCCEEQKMLQDIERSIVENAIEVLFLNFPNNPTGVVVSSEFMAAIVALARAKGCFVVHDFVYGEMNFERQTEPSLLQSVGGSTGFEGLIEIYSMSKAYSIPGWRVAVAAGDSRFIGLLSKLKSNVDYGNFLPIQLAAAHALYSKDDLCAEVAAQYASRARLLEGGLVEIGWSVQRCSATPMLWCELPVGYGAVEFCKSLLQGYGISIAPGCDYGAEYASHVRIALVSSEEKLQQVLDSVRSLTERW